MALEIKTIHKLRHDFHFVLDSEVDHIQSVIRGGNFYETEELELIAELAGAPRRILDVGSNLGNHAIYFAHRFNAELTVPVEPNPRILPMLRANLGLNWHPSFDLSLVGYGLSDGVGHGVSKVGSEENLGGAKLEQDAAGTVPITSGDIRFPSSVFDLIKIDVDGMENTVIRGMVEILRRSNALVFVEVLLPHIGPTIEQMRDCGYVYWTSHQRYGRCINLIFRKA
jgi:FkbM family methyltransferase